MDISEQIINILIDFRRGKISSSEKQILDKWIQESESNRKIFESFADNDFTSEKLKLFYFFEDKKDWIKILKRTKKQKSCQGNKFHIQSWMKWSIAAMLAGILIGGYFYKSYKNFQPPPVVQSSDVKAPTFSSAFIKMDNGKIVMVDSIKAQTPFKLNGVEVQKNKAGQIVVRSDEGKKNANTINTLYNPRGSKIITIVLSDSTTVWLNSESFISYPVRFDKGERKVTISGEAYFEVAKSKTQKFIVTTSKMKTEVLGTHFDIKDYPNENSSFVVLLEGFVRVSNQQKGKVLLRPSQQATQNKKSQKLHVENADVDRAIAWKKGMFDFKDDDIYSIARQFGRWYDIKVQIDGDFGGETYSGIISRELSLMQVLQILKSAGVNYTLKKKTLFITKT